MKINKDKNIKIYKEIKKAIHVHKCIFIFFINIIEFTLI